jgi:hypothetical protein
VAVPERELFAAGAKLEYGTHKLRKEESCRMGPLRFQPVLALSLALRARR